MTKSKRGFAAMPKEKQRAIARRGGIAAHKKGLAHEFTSKEAKKWGALGGRNLSRNRNHMAEIGRLGGLARAAKQAARVVAARLVEAGK